MDGAEKSVADICCARRDWWNVAESQTVLRSPDRSGMSDQRGAVGMVE